MRRYVTHSARVHGGGLGRCEAPVFLSGGHIIAKKGRILVRFPQLEDVILFTAVGHGERECFSPVGYEERAWFSPIGNYERA
jgi:hypothetical protein